MITVHPKDVPLVAAYYRLREAAKEMLDTRLLGHIGTCPCRVCAVKAALHEIDALEKNPRADRPLGERRAQKARRKSVTRRR